MACIVGVNIPNHKRTVIGLTAIYGVGRSRAQKICEATGIPTDKKIKDLTDLDQDVLCKEIEKFLAESDLRRGMTMNIERLMDLGCYRGVRHHKGLPMRGQCTRTNTRTRKGPRKAGVAFKKQSVG